MNDMMPRSEVVILHGAGGSPEGNWFPWLAKELTQAGVAVKRPSFPTPQGQSLKTWFETFDDQVGPLRERHILVGHSIGAAFALRLMERSSTLIRGLILAAPFAAQLGLPAFDALNESFFAAPFNWTNLAQCAPNIICFAGEDDPYVPLSLSKSVADNLQARLQVIPRGGHLNADSRFLRFDALLKELSKLL